MSYAEGVTQCVLLVRRLTLCNTYGVSSNHEIATQGGTKTRRARLRLPWALECNAFGVEKNRSRICGDDIDWNVWEALGTIQGKESVNKVVRTYPLFYMVRKWP